MRGIVWIVVLGLVTGAEAKTISITIGQKAEVRGENLVAKITVGNTGDESAKSVAANLKFGDKTVRGKLHDDLAPNGTFEDELTITTGTLGEGRWPYSIAVDYADPDGAPFQALLVATQIVGNPPTPKLTVPEIKSNGIAESGPLSIKFKNMVATERDVTFRVIVPEGLEAQEPTGTIHLKGYGEDTTSVTILNRTALAGSRYPVFVAVEYDDGGVHQSTVAQGIVEIVAPRNFWEENQTLLIVGVGVVLALWLVLVLRRATAARARA